MDTLSHQEAVHKFTLSHSAKILLTFCASACFETSEIQKAQNVFISHLRNRTLQARCLGYYLHMNAPIVSQSKST